MKVLNSKIAGAVTIGGAIQFICTVFTLHVLQPRYDPVHQHMSELALGRYGSMMLIGFCGLGLSIFSAHIGLCASGAARPIRFLLVTAAASMTGAGIFTLDTTATIHVSLIVSAFMALVISMYLLPQSVRTFSSIESKMTSWALAAGTTLCVSLGGTIPDGIAQRAAAMCILTWLLWIGTRIYRLE